MGHSCADFIHFDSQDPEMKETCFNTPEKWSFMLEKKKVTQLPWHFLPSASAAIGMQLAA